MAKLRVLFAVVRSEFLETENTQYSYMPSSDGRAEFRKRNSLTKGFGLSISGFSSV